MTFHEKEIFHCFDRHHERIIAMAMSKDESLLFTGDNDGLVIMSDLNKKAYLRSFVHDRPIHALVATYDRKYLFASVSWGPIKMWDIGTGQFLASLDGHENDAGQIVVTPDSDFIVSGGRDRKVIIWDVKSKKHVTTLLGHEYNVTSLAITPDGEEIAIAGRDGLIKVWNRREEKFRLTIETHKVEDSSMTITDDGKYIITLGEDEFIDGKRIWSYPHAHTIRMTCIKTGKCIYKFRLFDQKWSPGLAAFSKNLQCAISGGCTDYKIKVIDLISKKVIKTFQDNDASTCLVFSERGEFIISGSNTVIKRELKETVESDILYEGQSAWPTAMAISPGGTILVVGENLDGTLSIFDLEKGLIRRITSGHNVINSIAFSNDGLHFMSVGKDRNLRIWDMMTLECEHILSGHESEVVSLAISNDFKYAASGDMDCTLKIWDIGECSCVHTSKDYKGWVDFVAFSPSGRHVFTHSSDYGEIKIWDMQKKHYVSPYEKMYLRMTAQTDDQKHIIALVANSKETEVDLKVLDIESGHCIRSTRIGRSISGAIALSRNAGRFVIATGSNSVRILDIDTGLPVFNDLNGHRGFISQMVITPNGKKIVTMSEDRTIKIWSIDDGVLLATIHSLNHGFLSETPPDEYSKHGWFWTNRPQLINIFERFKDGSESSAICPDDPRQDDFITAHNNQKIVLARIRGLNEYRSVMSRIVGVKNVGIAPN
ncbi:MAG: hypothetical protein HQK54_04140 [Oligoflexales bacterium]|nr:hypothetical protein [Oligoflexales bacterium]